MVRKYIYWVSTAMLCVIYPVATIFSMVQGDTFSQVDGALVYPAYENGGYYPAIFIYSGFISNVAA